MAGKPFCCQSGDGTDVLPKGWGLRCPSPGSSSPCAWDQHVRAAVVSGLPCGNARSLLEKVLTRSPRLVDSGAEPSAGAGRAARHSPGLVTPSPPLTAVASAGPWRPLSWVLTEATGQVQYSVSTVKAIWSSQSQPVLTKIVPF